MSSTKKKRNPFAKLFLADRPFLSDKSARIAEEAWDAAIDQAALQLSLDGMVWSAKHIRRTLKSSEQRKVVL